MTTAPKEKAARLVTEAADRKSLNAADFIALHQIAQAIELIAFTLALNLPILTMLIATVLL